MASGQASDFQLRLLCASALPLSQNGPGVDGAVNSRLSGNVTVTSAPRLSLLLTKTGNGRIVSACSPAGTFLGSYCPLSVNLLGLSLAAFLRFFRITLSSFPASRGSTASMSGDC